MASRNFNNLRQRTLKIYDNLKKSPREGILMAISTALVRVSQTESNIKSLTKTAKKNRLLINSILEMFKKKKKPKFTELVDPFARFFKKRKDGDGRGGLLKWLKGLGLFLTSAAARKMIKQLIKKAIKKLWTQTKKLVRKSVAKVWQYAKALGSKVSKISRKVWDIAKTITRKGWDVSKNLAKRGFEVTKNLGKSGLQVAKNTSKQVWRSTTRFAARAAPVVRAAVSQGAKMAIRGVAGVVAGGLTAAGSAIGYPLMIAAAAAAVGFGAYKLGRYLKLSEKLDDFIKKVSGGKYGNIVDLILGIGNGSVGNELYEWVKTKIGTLFDDAVMYLKLKTNDILGSLSPFANDPTLEEGGADGDGGTSGSVMNKSGVSGGGSDSPEAEGLDSSNQSFMDKMKGTPIGKAMDMGSVISGDSGGDYSSNVSGGDTAWQKLTGGQNTEITSPFGPRKSPKTGASSNHKGIDIRAKTGTPIYAVEDGYFSFKGSSKSKSGTGLQGYVKGSNSGLSYGFGHLSAIKAKEGPVSKGQLVAYSGNSGNSTGPHIHFSIQNKSGAFINPKNVHVPTSLAKPGAKNSKGQPAGTGTVLKSAAKAAPVSDDSHDADPGIGNDEIGGTEYSDYARNKKYAKSQPLSTENDYTTPESLISNFVKSQGVSLSQALNSKLSVAKQYVAGNLSTNDNVSPSTVQVMRQNSPARRSSTPSAHSAQQSQNATGSETSNKVKDPRGALNMDIVNAATSALFI